MTQWSNVWAIAPSLLLSLVLVPAGQCQVQRDTTLPTPSVVTRQGATLVITGGTQRGSTLFHSFSEFSPRGRTASFQSIDGSVAHVFARVTGANRSRINGVLELLSTSGAVSNVDLFLINPNGILFGQNAQLNVGGSFIATTAQQVNFADGTAFAALPTASPSLLTLSVPVGLQFGAAPAAIVNRSFVQLGTPDQPLDPTGDSFVGLRVLPRRTVALIGGDIRLPAGELTASAGRIEVGSVAAAGTVGMQPIPNGWTFDYSDISAFGAIALSAEADLDVSGGQGGTIRIWGDRLSLIQDSFIRANTFGSLDGGGIEITAGTVALDRSIIATSTSGTGHAGNLSLTTQQLSLSTGAQLASVTSDAGAAGTLTILARQGINLSGYILAGGGSVASSGIVVRNDSGATGNNGSIAITTPRLTLSNGAQISNDTFGSGASGSTVIEAVDVMLDGVARSPSGLVFALPNGAPAAPSALTAFSTSSSGSGSLSLITERLTVQNGAVIQTSTQGSGDAGALTLVASDRLTLSGVAPELGFPSGILTFAGGIPGTPFVINANATGRGGDLTVTGGTIQVLNGAVMAVGSAGESSGENSGASSPSGAGTLTLTGRSLQLDTGASLVANTTSGDGGNLRLVLQDYLTLRRGSQLSTTAGIAGAGGDGGNIVLQTPFVISALAENSDITANAFTGDGGAVQIQTEGIFGILPQSASTPRSDITASSEFGTSGEISITNLSDDPSRGLVALPEAVTDASQLVAQQCARQSAIARQSEFVVTGRGGLPPSPRQVQQPGAIATQWATVAETAEPAAAIPTVSSPVMGDARAPGTLASGTLALEAAPLWIEAQGWQHTPSGQVELVATAFSSARENVTACHHR
ncbi:MAG: filamentous hemagglutinin N-terminal domain-containing protein [Kaiparowitsia implicata GSE-PSE-MK54-09C]|jgi:filamentous hemagglutinin family protein|nr:filamentous hemagglutinin N-terminal domain-containing protein [Kaiparowitsia implicata GSE-PSE-MK54-09C]